MEITVDQLLSLAKRHARSISSTVFFITVSFVLMLAYGSAWASGVEVDGAMYGVAFFVALFFSSIAYLVIYLREGLLATSGLWPVMDEPQPQPEPIRERPPVPARAPSRERPSYAATVAVTSMLYQLEKQVAAHATWFQKVSWSGVCRAVRQDALDDDALRHYMPPRVLEGTEQEPGFVEVMEDIGFVHNDQWTPRAKEIFREIGQELSPPSPTVGPPDFSALTGVTS